MPMTDDRALFEKLDLEGFQAGLSWLTILRKRENFRQAFHDFDAARIARFTERDIARLMNDDGIIRNRAKIEATISNAKAYLALSERLRFRNILGLYRRPPDHQQADNFKEYRQKRTYRSG